MGGWGSGRSKGWARNTTEHSLPLDIRRLYREGLLVSGMRITSRWWTGTNKDSGSSIGALVVGDWDEAAQRVLPRRLLLSYNHQGEPVEQSVPIVYTSCHYGGMRPWFHCPCSKNGVPCYRRVAVLYGAGRLFACRHCYELAYSTQHEDRAGRLLAKSLKIRERLGQTEGGVMHLFPEKPRGMWWRTYWRLHAQGNAAEEAQWQALSVKLDKRMERVRGRLGEGW